MLNGYKCTAIYVLFAALTEASRGTLGIGATNADVIPAQCSGRKTVVTKTKMRSMQALLPSRGSGWPLETLMFARSVVREGKEEGSFMGYERIPSVKLVTQGRAIG